MADEQSTSLNTIRELLRRDPFIPFRIVMSSGDPYTIESADAMAIGRSQLHYYLPHSEMAVHLRLNQISSVEELGEAQSV